MDFAERTFATVYGDPLDALQQQVLVNLIHVVFLLREDQHLQSVVRMRNDN